MNDVNCTAPAPRPVIKDHLTVNIVLLCIACTCVVSVPALATGILGVVFASQARTYIEENNLAQAQKKAKAAKSLAIATGVLIGLMLLYYVLFFTLYFAMMFGFAGLSGLAVSDMLSEFGFLSLIP